MCDGCEPAVKAGAFHVSAHIAIRSDLSYFIFVKVALFIDGKIR